MTMSTVSANHLSQDAPRCQQRRRQILDAAAACFAREGFHGTSIATISRHAGMSAGHIYHFFTNKEAIVAALVEQRLEQVLEMVEQFESAEDVFQAMLDRVDLGLRERTDPALAALELEILAEAARNPRVAAMVHEADAIRRARIKALVQRTQRRHSPHDNAEAVTEVLMALFEGLTARAVNHPELDREALAPLLRTVMRALL